jgi:HEAT repeat protein
MGKKDDPEMRACAAMALGKVGTPKAMESLNRAASEKDVIVRNAVSRAIRRSPA